MQLLQVHGAIFFELSPRAYLRPKKLAYLYRVRQPPGLTTIDVRQYFKTTNVDERRVDEKLIFKTNTSAVDGVLFSPQKATVFFGLKAGLALFQSVQPAHGEGEREKRKIKKKKKAVRIPVYARCYTRVGVSTSISTYIKALIVSVCGIQLE